MRNMLETTALKYPEKTAIVYESMSWTYSQFLKRTYMLGNALKEIYVYKGDRIAVLMKNRPEYFEVYYGVSGIGGIVVPLNTRLGIKEIMYILKHSGANTLIYENDFEDIVQQVKAEIKGIKNYLLVGSVTNTNDISYHEILEQSSEFPPLSKAEDDDIAFICYTSGTTGNPKGTMITHRNIATMCSNQLIELPRDKNYVGMVLFPFFHIGVVMGFNKIALGLTCIFSDFHPRKIAELIEKYKINDIEIPATQLRMFVNSPEAKDFDLSSLKIMTTGGGFSSPNTLLKLFSLFADHHDLQVANVYGMTENTAHAMSNVINPKNIHQKIAEMESLPNVKASGFGAGKPIFGIQAKVVDENMNSVAPYEIGEIIIKGDTVMKGYWQEPEKTKEVLTPDGWYLTGDLGLQLENGGFFVIDRKNYKIVTGDENVYPAEVENILSTHSSIKEVAVFGVYDEKWMEIVKAVVVLQPGMEITEENIREYCIGKIANYKIPKSITFVDQLPINAAGKILKNRLIKMYSK